MQVAIVGYSGSGKTTLFELLTGTPSDPASAHTGQRAMAQLDDPRLPQIAAIYESKKVTPAAIEIHDIPGLVRGSSKDNAQRLAALREADGLALVIGAFAGANPQSDLAAFDDDLLLADLELISGALERLRAAAAKPRPDRESQLAQIALLEPIEAALSSATPLRDVKLSAEQQHAIRSFRLLTEKPQLVVVNTSEKEQAQHPPAGHAGEGARLASTPDSSSVFSVCLKLHRELAELDPEERAAFQHELGLSGGVRDGLLAALRETCGRIVFFTANQREVRAWLSPRGSDAVTAAGHVHSDMARGFIRAEVISTDALLQAGSVRQAKAEGLFLVEGRDYQVQDGDLLLVRFSV